MEDYRGHSFHTSRWDYEFTGDDLDQLSTLDRLLDPPEGSSRNRQEQMAAKVVYYGPGLCGKTTNLQFIYDKTNPSAKGKLISLATETDRTLFFDFLPLELGNVRGFKTRFHLYTVPGQVFYNATRRMVLKGADGVVFVGADRLVAEVAAGRDDREAELSEEQQNAIREAIESHGDNRVSDLHVPGEDEPVHGTPDGRVALRCGRQPFATTATLRSHPRG